MTMVLDDGLTGERPTGAEAPFLGGAVFGPAKAVPLYKTFFEAEELLETEALSGIRLFAISLLVPPPTCAAFQRR